MQLLALCAAILLQTAGPQTELRSASVSIVDEAGAPLRGLGIDDVALLENGVARSLRSFEPDERPLHLAILVDSSQPVSSAYRQQVVPALTGFLAGLPQGTLYTIWTLGDRPRKIIENSDERARAGVALQRVFPQGGNTLLDGLMDASKELEIPEGDRGAIVIVTGDGVGFSNYERREVAKRVGAGDATVHAVIFEGAVDTPGVGVTTSRVDYDYVIDELTRRTGGRSERVLTPMALGHALSAILSELTGRYRLTYETVADLDERQLALEVAHPGAKVRLVAPERR